MEKIKLKYNQLEATPIKVEVVTYQFNWANTKLKESKRESMEFNSSADLREYLKELTEINAKLLREARKRKSSYYLAKQIEIK